MTIIQAITQARSVKPNDYDDEILVAWLSELDGMIYHEYIVWHEQPIIDPQPEPAPLPDTETPNNGSTAEEGLSADDTEAGTAGDDAAGDEQQSQEIPHGPYDPEKDMDTVLLVPEPYSSLYVKYIAAQVDYYNGEIGRYNNSMVMFNMALASFADFYNRTNMPRQDNYIQF